MAEFSCRSVFQDIRSRELNGWKARKRPLLWDQFAVLTEPTSQAVTVREGDNDITPLAISYCKTVKNSHIIAVSDDEGFVSLHNTRYKFSPMVTPQENTGGQQFVDSFYQSYYEGVGCAAKEMHRIIGRTQRECKICLFTSYKFRSDCFWFKRRVLCFMGFKMQGWQLPLVYHLNWTSCWST